MTKSKSARPLSVAEFRDLAKSYVPAAVKALRDLAGSANPRVASDARKLLARAETQGDIHLSDSAPEMNTIKGFQDAERG